MYAHMPILEKVTFIIFLSAQTEHRTIWFSLTKTKQASQSSAKFQSALLKKLTNQQHFENIVGLLEKNKRTPEVPTHTFLCASGNNGN